jgi:iron complex outermembrane recepter protein
VYFPAVRALTILSRLMLGLLYVAPAILRAAPMDFDLPAQPADVALMAFSKQTKIDVLFSFEALRTQRSTAVVGRFEPEDALARLLQGTGFVAQRTGPGKYVVTALKAPTGALKGRLVLPDGKPAVGVRVSVGGTRESTKTDAQGEFAFAELPPATYRLGADGEHFQAVQFKPARIEADETFDLGTHTIEKATDPSRLAPFVVEDSSDHGRAFDRNRTPTAPRIAGGNLDLRRSENGALPFTIYDRNQIVRSGVVNLNEFLQRELLDAQAGAVPPEQNGMTNAFVAGSTNLTLRGYGADETVILVNGRRLPEVVTSGFGPDHAFRPPDVNMIPLSLVQQVEVLPVSASALYTGNPVGGVINIVLRPGGDVNVTEISGTYTNAMHGFDAPQSSMSLLHTRNLLGGKLRLRMSASFAQSTPATESELGHHLGRAPPPLALETSIYRATPYVRSAGLVPLFGPGTAPVTSVAPGADGNGGLAAFAGREGMPNLDFFQSPGGYAASLDSYDYPYGRRQKREVYFGSVVYDPFPWLQIGLEGSFARTIVNRGYEVFANDLTVRPESPLNPFRRPIAVSLLETTPQLGQDYNQAQIEFSSLALGLLVKLPADWRLAFDAQYARNLTKYRGLAGVDYNRWQQLVDQGRYNPLRDTQLFGPPQAFYDEVLIYRGGRGRFVPLGDYTTWDIAARGTNESLKLPTGLSTVNVGFDYRVNDLARYIDERRFGTGELAEDSIRYAGRMLERYSVFGELQVPIVPVNRLPSWIRSADADVAVRYVASSSARESNVAPTYGLKVDFVNGLSFRGSLTTSSRFPTPNMSRIALRTPTGGTGTGAEPVLVLDPVRNSQTYTVRAEEALNPDLQPEGAVTQTAGLVFRRGNVHRFRASLDFVDTHKVNELVFLDASMVVLNESLWPERVRRAPVQSNDNRNTGLITSVLTGTTNLAWRRSQNWNTSLNYAWTECLGGTLELHTRLIYFSRYQRQVLPNSPIVDELNNPSGTATGLLKYRSNFGANWSNRNYGIGMDGHYFHSRVLPIAEWATQRSGRIDPFWQFDGYVQAELSRWLPGKLFTGGLRAQLRVNNLFGREFPAYANEGTGAGVQPYGDWRGRVYSLSLTAAF